MRRALSIILLGGVLAGAALADAGYKAATLEGKIGERGERRDFEITYEKLSKKQRLVNEAHFNNLPVSCKAPGAEDSVSGVLAAFHQPTEIWVFNKRKGIGGRRDFAHTWAGKDVPIEAPDGDRTRFRGKQASLSGEFAKGFRRAGGDFSIRWKEVEAGSGELLFACSVETEWFAKRGR